MGYPVGTLPDRNWKGSVYDFSRNRSPDGALESKGPAFGGALRGYLLVVEYSAGDDILALPIPPHGGPIDRTGVLQVAAGLSDPVDLAEDPTNGNLYVAQLVQGGLDGGAIVLLRQDGGTPCGRCGRWVWWPFWPVRSAVATTAVAEEAEGRTEGIPRTAAAPVPRAAERMGEMAVRTVGIRTAGIRTEAWRASRRRPTGSSSEPPRGRRSPRS
ncbi:MAG: hypothetical protein ACXWLA_12815 [Myxococcaceae bacterium]